MLFLLNRPTLLPNSRILPLMNFRLLFVAFAFGVVILSSQAQAQEKYRVYLGTYTGKESKGIYQCELNLKDGSLSAATLAGETSSPSFLAFHPNKKFLYAVNEEEATSARSPSTTKRET